MSTALLSPATTDAQIHAAEAATGCVGRSNLGTFYVDGGVAILPDAAAKAIRAEKTIEVPNAGAGGYLRFFADLGFDQARTINDSSSAGDWFLGVRDAATGQWHPAWQHNRYPRHGFSYSMEAQNVFSSFEELCEYSSRV